MEDWDAQYFQPVAPIVGVKSIKSNWDDEDVEEDDIKESWEEEAEASGRSLLQVSRAFCKEGRWRNVTKAFIPKSESDFAEYAELIANKVRPYEKSFHYMGLLKNVMRLSMTSLTGTDAKEISSSVAAISNEKIKAKRNKERKRSSFISIYRESRGRLGRPTGCIL